MAKEIETAPELTRGVLYSWANYHKPVSIRFRLATLQWHLSEIEEGDWNACLMQPENDVRPLLMDMYDK